MIKREELTNEVFDHLWSTPDPVPIVVPGVNAELEHSWDPAFFIEHFGDQICQVQNCYDPDMSMKQTIREFFSRFGQHYDGRLVLRVKVQLHETRSSTILTHIGQDWPPTADFKTTFPFCLLYFDLIRVIPVPDIARPDGLRNLASYFPISIGKPDLGNGFYTSSYCHIMLNRYTGPKMYIAYKDMIFVGSTKLHMDLTDAFNLMTFADGVDGFARWLIFARSDAAALAEWLRESKGLLDNGIHQQNTFLTSADLDDLFEKKGVKPYIIDQRPGDLIFIPAGCPHQASSLLFVVLITNDFPADAFVAIRLAIKQTASRLPAILSTPAALPHVST